MPFKCMSLCVVAALASVALAKDPRPYQTGTLLAMDSVACGTAEKATDSLAGEVAGTDSGSKKTQRVLCQQYLLESERVIYRIRPGDRKHSVLLPVGDRAQFRIQKDKMLVRVEDLDHKEHEYIVVSMTPRSEASSASAAAALNHLQ
jgi:hypothetical protein